MLAKSCKECNLEKHKNKKKALKLKSHHLWFRKDGSKIADPLEIVDNHKRHDFAKCRKQKAVKEFVTYSLKYNPNLSKVYKICNDYCRKEDQRLKRREFKDEWYWNGHLIRNKTNDIFTPAEIVISTCEDSEKAVMSKGSFFTHFCILMLFLFFFIIYFTFILLIMLIQSQIIVLTVTNSYTP